MNERRVTMNERRVTSAEVIARKSPKQPQRSVRASLVSTSSLTALEKADARGSRNSLLSKAGEPPSPPRGHRNKALSFCFKKKICGDVFGQSMQGSMQGMMYRARVESCVRDSKLLAAKENYMRRQTPDEDKNDETAQESTVCSDSDTDTESDNEYGENLGVRQRVALTLRNWSMDETNINHVVEEGGIEAMIALAAVDDKTIKNYCASAFCSVARQSKFRRVLLEAGAVKALVQLAAAMHHAGRSTKYCAQALCYLTLVDGGERQMAEEGAVVALVLLMGIDEKIAPICARALFNMTCFRGESYPAIDRVIKALVALPVTNTMDPKLLCARGLCNCSNTFKLRLRMIDEGAVQALTNISQSNDDKTKHIAAVTLYNMSTARGCRPDLLIKGSMTALLALSLEEDLDTLFCVASTLQKLALDFGSRVRFIKGRVFVAITQILERSREPRTTQKCSSALQVMTCRDDCIAAIVQHGAVDVLNTLCRTNDTETQQNCASAFCNLLSMEECHADIIKEDAIPTILYLASNLQEESITQSLAFAVHNLSCGKRTRESVVDAGVVPALVEFSKSKNVRTQSRCAAALCNLACNDRNIKKMVEEGSGVISALIRMLNGHNPDVMKQCATVLGVIAFDRDSHLQLVEEAAVPAVIAAAVAATEPETDAACCAAVASLSFCESTRVQMVQIGVLPVICEFAQMDDPATRRRCATSLCNLSCEANMRRQMIEADVLPVLSNLSNTYSEEAQQDCAKALCNLSCCVGQESAMVEQGGVSALMMIAMVRAVSPLTKHICGKALLNLLCADTVDSMLEEGVVQAFASLCSLKSQETMKTCATAFCMLSCSHDGRVKIASRKSNLASLFSLMRSSSEQVLITCGKAVSNLLMFEESAVNAIKAGGLSVIKVMSTMDHTRSQTRCLDAIAFLSQFKTVRDSIVKERAFAVPVLLSQSAHRDVVLSSMRCLVCMAFHKNCHRSLVVAGTVPALVAIVMSGTYFSDLQEHCSRVFCYLAMAKDNRAQMVKEGAVPALNVLCRVIPDPKCQAYCARTLASFSWSKTAQRRMVEDGAVSLLSSLLQEGHDKDSARDMEVARDCSVAFANLSHRKELRQNLMDDGVITTLALLVESGEADSDSIWRICACLYYTSQSVEHRINMVKQGAVKPLVVLAEQGNAASAQCCAAALCNLSKSRSSRQAIVDDGAVPVLIKMSECDNSYTKHSCAVALGNLSANAHVEAGTVSALLQLSLSYDSPHGHVGPSEDDVGQMVNPTTPSRKRTRATTMLQSMVASGAFTAKVEMRDAVGDLLDLPPPLPLELSNDNKEHHRIINALLRPNSCTCCKWGAGPASQGLPPPEPLTLESVQDGRLGGADEQDDANHALAIGADDIIEMHFPKLKSLPAECMKEPTSPKADADTSTPEQPQRPVSTLHSEARAAVEANLFGGGGSGGGSIDAAQNPETRELLPALPASVTGAYQQAEADGRFATGGAFASVNIGAKSTESRNRGAIEKMESNMNKKRRGKRSKKGVAGVPRNQRLERLSQPTAMASTPTVSAEARDIDLSVLQAAFDMPVDGFL